MQAMSSPTPRVAFLIDFYVTKIKDIHIVKTLISEGEKTRVFAF